MGMTYLSLGAACCLFVGVLAHASFTDLKRRRIMNVAVLALLAGYLPFAALLGVGTTEIVTGLVAGVLVFVIGFACFCAGWMGGGDVKLAAVITLWLGANLVLPFLMLSAVFGGLLALLFLGLRHWQARIDHGQTPPVEGIPYGPALVLAALILFPSSHWFAVV
ncbi:MAG: prepilin peptidase [Pseudomonadota bacterium]